MDSSLEKGEKALDHKNSAGIRVSAKRALYLNGKAAKTEVLPSSYYRAVTDICKISLGTEGVTSSTLASPAAASSKLTSSTPSSSTASSSQASSSSHTLPQPASSQLNTASSDSSGQMESEQ